MKLEIFDHGTFLYKVLWVIVNNFTGYNYANDTSLYLKFDSPPELEYKIEETADWFRKWLSFSSSISIEQ